MKAFKAGVYLLYDKGEVVYVGQSKNPMLRIGSHVAERKKQFDEFQVYETEDYDGLEAFLISALRPKYNQDYPYTPSKKINVQPVIDHVIEAQKEFKIRSNWNVEMRKKHRQEIKKYEDIISALKMRNRELQDAYHNLQNGWGWWIPQGNNKENDALKNKIELERAMRNCDLGTVSKAYHEYAKEIYAS